MTYKEKKKWENIIKNTEEYLKNISPEQRRKMQDDYDSMPSAEHYLPPEGLELILPDNLK